MEPMGCLIRGPLILRSPSPAFCNSPPLIPFPLHRLALLIISKCLKEAEEEGIAVEVQEAVAVDVVDGAGVEAEASPQPPVAHKVQQVKPLREEDLQAATGAPVVQARLLFGVAGVRDVRRGRLCK